MTNKLKRVTFIAHLTPHRVSRLYSSKIQYYWGIFFLLFTQKGLLNKQNSIRATRRVRVVFVFDPLNFKRKHNIESGHNSILEVIGSFVGFFFPSWPSLLFPRPPPLIFAHYFSPSLFALFFLSSGGWALFLSSPWEIECTRNGGRGGGREKTFACGHQHGTHTLRMYVCLLSPLALLF